MRSGTRGLLVLAVAAGFLLTGEGVGAQEPGDVRVGLIYTPVDLPGLAMPEIRTEREELEETAKRIDSILRRNLDYSNRFRMISVPDDLRREPDVRYDLWNELQAMWLVTGEVTGTRERPVLRLELHDVVYRELTEVRAFSLPALGNPDFRMSVHRTSDDLVEWATGERGIAATRIAFRRRGPDGVSDIWMVDADGHGLRQVTHDSSIVYSPAFSPDGRRLAYVSYVTDRPVVYERALDGGEPRTVSDVPGVNLTPAFRPDGERLLVARSVEGGTDIYELNASPPWNPRRVTYYAPEDALNASYDPAGRRIVFEATPLGEQQIYVQNMEGGGPGIISRYLYGERGTAAAPDWSPAGDRIAYQGWIDGTFQIVTVNPDGSERRILTSEGRNEEPNWAPDGRHLVFRSTRGGHHGLWILDTVTGRLRSLTVNHVDQMPEWSSRIPAPAASGGR